MERRRGLPGGIGAPAAVLAASAALFVVAARDPELIDLGPHFSPAGLGVLGAALSAFWLLAAIGARRP
jgi:hypothetical protein